MVLSAIMNAGGREAQLAHALRRVRLFRDAPARDLVALWRQLTEVRFGAGAIVCERGQPGNCLYVVQAGSVEVRLGVGPSGISLNRLGPGDCVGEMALLTGEPRSADVVAIEDSILWALNRRAFEHILSNNISLLRAFNRSLAERLARATWQIEQMELEGPSRSPTGLRFGPYRVIAQLGSGGMAVVYSAVRIDDGTAVALKVLPASWGAAPEFRARLAREAAVLQRIQHHGVIQLIDVGAVSERLGGGTYVAMEWLPNGLDRVLRAQYPDPLTLTGALRIARDVAEALSAVHAAGVLHRDVKPANILLRANGQPVLTDFGLAAALSELATNQRLTPENVLVGTADYLAPEMINGDPVDERADLYALGVVLYEMLTGFVPFAGRDPIETLRAHCEESPPSLPTEVPPAARAIVECALQKRPEDRFTSSVAMAESITAALQQADPSGPCTT
jgi:serine/threonine protein kinase